MDTKHEDSGSCDDWTVFIVDWAQRVFESADSATTDACALEDRAKRAPRHTTIDLFRRTGINTNTPLDSALKRLDKHGGLDFVDRRIIDGLKSQWKCYKSELYSECFDDIRAMHNKWPGVFDNACACIGLGNINSNRFFMAIQSTRSEQMRTSGRYNLLMDSPKEAESGNGCSSGVVRRQTNGKYTRATTMIRSDQHTPQGGVARAFVIGVVECAEARVRARLDKRLISEWQSHMDKFAHALQRACADMSHHTRCYMPPLKIRAIVSTMTCSYSNKLVTRLAGMGLGEVGDYLDNVKRTLVAESESKSDSVKKIDRSGEATMLNWSEASLRADLGKTLHDWTSEWHHLLAGYTSAMHRVFPVESPEHRQFHGGCTQMHRVVTKTLRELDTAYDAAAKDRARLRPDCDRWRDGLVSAATSADCAAYLAERVDLAILDVNNARAMGLPESEWTKIIRDRLTIERDADIPCVTSMRISDYDGRVKLSISDRLEHVQSELEKKMSHLLKSVQACQLLSHPDVFRPRVHLTERTQPSISHHAVRHLTVSQVAHDDLQQQLAHVWSMVKATQHACPDEFDGWSADVNALRSACEQRVPRQPEWYLRFIGGCTAMVVWAQDESK